MNRVTVITLKIGEGEEKPVWFVDNFHEAADYLTQQGYAWLAPATYHKVEDGRQYIATYYNVSRGEVM